MIHYYFALPKNGKLDFSTNINVSKGIWKTTEEAIKPIEEALKISKENLAKKEGIKSKWKKVKSHNIIQLNLKGSLYNKIKKTKVKIHLVNKKFKYKVNFLKELNVLDFDENIIIIYENKTRKKIRISEDEYNKNENTFLYNEKINLENIIKISWGGIDINISLEHLVLDIPFKKGEKIIQKNREKEKYYNISNIEQLPNEDKVLVELEGYIKENQPLYYNGVKLDYEILEKINLPEENEIVLKEYFNKYIIYNKNKNSKNETSKIIHSLDFDFDFPVLDNGEILKAELIDKNKLKYSIENEDYLNKIQNMNVKIGELEFSIKKIEQNKRDEKFNYLIQLVDENNDRDDIPGFNPLKYFFDDEITIQDEKGNEYFVDWGNEKELQLILKRRNDKGKLIYTLPEGKTLEVKINTYQIKKQIEALNTLRTMPVEEHINLINLFNDKKHTKWKNFHLKDIQEWHILTNNNRSGIEEQRKFVKKAISTPDFAILEGPPGSGKTTVILELILQLIKQGKKILLAGSTHVAVDNVLERLKNKFKDGKSYLEYFNILPIRIGDKNRISENVREFQLDDIKERNNMSDEDLKLILDSANLVCGTTIGILQHPYFKGRKNVNTPIVPSFDYLIIDESSKTTFQEFLVPALYAKKWILVGDVMQLSPFTNKEYIVANIDTIVNDKDLKEAIFFLFHLNQIFKYNNDLKIIFPIGSSTLKEFLNEYINRYKNQYHEKIFEKRILVIENLTLINTKNYVIDNIEFLDIKNLTDQRLKLVAYDLILINQAYINEVLDYLPETHIILRKNNWEETKHAYLTSYYFNYNKIYLKNKDNNSNNLFKIVQNINTLLTEKNWAEEIAWRLDRIYQLRLRENKKIKHYKETINRLIPLTYKEYNKKEIIELIDEKAAIFFPSILESLIHGIQGIKINKSRVINEGFNKEDLEKRREILVYQHRMHPDISRFPREQFYKEKNALKDLEQPQQIKILRNWNYNKYSQRSVWIDVRGETIKNYNQEEIKVLIKELKDFLEWALQHPYPEENKDWTIACLTFYRGQESRIRDKLRELTGLNAYSIFRYGEELGRKIKIMLYTVDKFQGHEADIVFLSMVQTKKDGFLDNPNRLNVAITRARYQLVIIGNHTYFSNYSKSEDLKNLANSIYIISQKGD